LQHHLFQMCFEVLACYNDEGIYFFAAVTRITTDPAATSVPTQNTALATVRGPMVGVNVCVG